MSTASPRFQLDVARYQLLEGDQRVHLERQPMELLIMLVGRRGELVTREEIAEKFWGKEVFVDADQSINRSIRKLRVALHDDPEAPRFVETVVGKGYRFIGPIEFTDKAEPPPPMPLAQRELSAPVTLDATKSGARFARPWIIAAVTTGIALVAIAGSLQRLNAPRSQVEGVQFTIEVPTGATLGHNADQRGRGTAAPHFAPSPDGRRLAYVMVTTGKPQLWVRDLDALNGHPLPGTDDATFPFWSPDSRFIGFFADGKLKKVDASEGTVDVICDAPAGEGGTWNQGGVIVFAPDDTSALFKVAASGGIPSRLTTLDGTEREVSHRWPQFLPDGRHFLYLAMSGQVGTFLVSAAAVGSTRATYVGTLDSQERTLVLRGALRTAYAAGYLLFLRERTLMAQPFDIATFHLSGEPKPVAEHVASNTGNGRTGFAVSQKGVLAYRGSSSDGRRRLAWIDRQGRPLDLLEPPTNYGVFHLSPDGKKLAAYVRDRATGTSGDLRVFALTDGKLSPALTLASRTSEAGFAWSPDGNQIAYATGDNEAAIYRHTAIAIGAPQLVVTSPHSKEAGTWSADGQYLAYTQLDAKTRKDIWLVQLIGTQQPIPFLQTESNEEHPAFSPDGRWFAYTSDKGGIQAVYVRPFPADNREWRISTGEGTSPQWRADTEELFYFSRGDVMAVPVKRSDSNPFGVPVKLFSVPINPGRFGQYAVSADGQRFLVIEQQDTRRLLEMTPLVVRINWTAAVQR